ncbi:MAG: TonB-dependent receptor [Melioribacteraceae bacterium]|nr:TonB-dependent receptor [Melioribacteraceae bacterium]MCF8354590.1 TonB-dependent receptor [Melioribacteraceae bacterium]MCF8394942.1 TonB-dependent receptor [Melioribacteraceae bacterium]MCF8420167.1 TonB-dependent receptor [Melioribacteraceae bacterium]
MKKIVLIILFPVLLFAQEQGIELPDFVITGVQSVNIPTLAKSRPELVSTLSKEFFNPNYSPEAFTLAEFSNPLKKELDLYDKIPAIEGRLILGAGLQTRPTGEFHYNKSFRDVIIYSKVWGTKIEEYKTNAGYNVSGAKLKSDFFIGNNSKFLPGLKIGVDGQYIRNSYKFFGSVHPSFQRDGQNGEVNLSFLNYFDKNINYGLNLNGNMLMLAEKDFSELVYSAEGFFNLKFPKIDFNIQGEFIRQTLKNHPSAVLPDENFYSGQTSLRMKPFGSFQFKFGVNYQASRDYSKIKPFFSGFFKVDKYVSLIATYNPHSEFHTFNDYLNRNRYLSSNLFTRNIVEYKSDLMIGIKYEYEKYFEINGGAGYSKINNFPFFYDRFSLTGNPQFGYFDVYTANDVERIYAYLNLLFHLGPYGTLYSDSEVQSFKIANDQKIPYEPTLSTNVTYSYDFKFGVTAGTTLHYRYKTYYQLGSRETLPDYINLSFFTSYELFKNFRLTASVSNVMNRENFYWFNYQEKPFDVIAGLDYVW